MSVTELAEDPTLASKRVTWGGDEKGKDREMKEQCPKGPGLLKEHSKQVRGFRKVCGVRSQSPNST